MQYISRTLEKSFLEATDRFKVLMLSGMRQVGKSTMLTQIATRTCVTLDNRIALDTAQNMPEVFFKQYPPPILIDEIQRSPQLALAIKELVDADLRKGLVWLTGSQRFELMKNTSESLAGRLASFQLLPFSLYERQNKAFEQKPYIPEASLQRGSLNALNDEETWKIIWQGSWPEVIDDNAKFRDLFFNGLIQTYLERDIVHTGVSKLRDFERFLVVLASRIGQEFQISKVAAEVGIAVPTARDWLSIAESSGVIYLLQPFYENIGKTVIKKPKLYFTDTGLAAWLCGIASGEALKNYYNSGAFFENFVIIELLKTYLHNGLRPHFYFYRDAQYNEIDLLIKEGTTYHPIEIKTTTHPEVSMTKAFANIKGTSFERGMGSVICLTAERRFLRSDVIAHSIWDI